MAPIDEPASFEPSPPEAAERRAKPKPAEPGQRLGGDLVAFTINTTTGRIEKVEGVDASGARRNLTDEEKTRLLTKAAEVTLEGVVERAFEAGIECAFGDDDSEDGEDADLETEEDADVRHLLLRSLMADTSAQRLMQREVLSRAIAGTLIEQAVGAESGRTH